MKSGYVVKTLTGPKRYVADLKAVLAQGIELRKIPNEVEIFTSVYAFGPELESILTANNGRVAGLGTYPVAVPWLTWDIDAADELSGVAQARELILFLRETYGIYRALQVNLSGSRGVHVRMLLPGAVGLDARNSVAARFYCEAAAKKAGVDCDGAIYTANHVIRLPNSLNAKKGRFAVPLTVDELFGLSPKEVTGRAVQQIKGMAVDWSNDWDANNDRKFQADWSQAIEASGRRVVEAKSYITTERTRLPFQIEKWMAEGLPRDDGRKRALFRCGAAMGELLGPSKQAETGIVAILLPLARKCGLDDRTAIKQIVDGIKHGSRDTLDTLESVPTPDWVADQQPVYSPDSTAYLQSY